MTDTLIWAAAIFIPLMTLVVWLARPMGRAIDKWGSAHEISQAERDAKAQETLLSVEEGRHQLAVDELTIEQQAARQRARLETETEQYRVDQKAAERTLDSAIAARNHVLAARAAAEAELAPELARKTLSSDDLSVLGDAYAEFCRNYGYAGVPTFAAWVGNFRGLA